MFDINVTVTLVTQSQKYLIGEQGDGFKNILKRELRKTIIYDLVKPNSTKKLEQYRWCNMHMLPSFFGKWKYRHAGQNFKLSHKFSNLN